PRWNANWFMTNVPASLRRGFHATLPSGKILSSRRCRICWPVRRPGPATLTTVTTGAPRAGQSAPPAKFAHMNRREKLEALLADSPDDSFLRYALALALEAEGDPCAARARLEALVESDPHYVPAYFQLARLQIGQ